MLITHTPNLQTTRDFFHANVRVDTVIFTYSSSFFETVARTVKFQLTSREINENFNDLETRPTYSRPQGLNPIPDSMEKVLGPESIVCESYPFGSRFEHCAAHYWITVELNMSIFILNSCVSNILDTMEVVSYPEKSVRRSSLFTVYRLNRINIENKT